MATYRKNNLSITPTIEAKCASELIGTFFLMCAIGCNANTASIGAAVSVGCTLAVMVYALGSVSGAHFNPAVTLAIWLSGRGKIKANEGVGYVLAQLAGGVAAALFNWAALPERATAWDGFHLPGAGKGYTEDQAIGCEVIYSCALCYVVLNVATTEVKPYGSTPNGHYGVAIGLTVTAAAIAICPISGCSLNPAITLGSAFAAFLANGQFPAFVWAHYVLAPILGAFLGAFLFWLVRGGLFNRYEYEEITMLVERDIEAPVRPSPRQIHFEAPADPVSLSTDKAILLPEEVYDDEIVCSLRWAVTKSGSKSMSCDIDLTAVKFGRSGDCLGAVYFAKKQDKGIRHSGDDVIGDVHAAGKPEKVFVRLNEIKSNIHAIVFVVMIYSGEKFDDLTSYCMSLANASDGNKEFCRYKKKHTKDGANAQIASLLFRSGNKWYFKAIDQCHSVPANSSYRKLMGPMQDIVAKQLSEMNLPKEATLASARSHSEASATPRSALGDAL